jgi:hypothetical protein
VLARFVLAKLAVTIAEFIFQLRDWANVVLIVETLTDWGRQRKAMRPLAGLRRRRIK